MALSPVMVNSTIGAHLGGKVVQPLIVQPLMMMPLAPVSCDAG